MAERKRRGFASMSEDRQRAIASLGGKAAHAQGRAHEFSPDEARAAGKKGGQAVRAKYGPEFYANIGRIGGGRRGRSKLANAGSQASPPQQAARPPLMPPPMQDTSAAASA